jgi:predicted DCC family thiol-disulfide oxidoreductase YuxK
VSEWTVLYDDDCGFCRWSADVLLRADRRGVLRVLSIQSREGAAMLSSVPEAERLASWHLVGPNGERRSAGAAVPAVLRLLPAGAPLAPVAERFPGAVERLYRLVARNRGRLGRLIGRKACAVDPSRRPRPSAAGARERT